MLLNLETDRDAREALRAILSWLERDQDAAVCNLDAIQHLHEARHFMKRTER